MLHLKVLVFMRTSKQPETYLEFMFYLPHAPILSRTYINLEQPKLEIS